MFRRRNGCVSGGTWKLLGSRRGRRARTDGLRVGDHERLHVGAAHQREGPRLRTVSLPKMIEDVPKFRPDHHGQLPEHGVLGRDQSVLVDDKERSDLLAFEVTRAWSLAAFAGAVRPEQ